MQIVIDIPEEVKAVFDKATKDDIYGCYYDFNSVIGKAIKNGTPLPKGHGRLIDADIVIGDIDTERVNLFMDGLKGTPREYSHLNDLQRIIDEIPTIVEADKEEQNNDK